MYLHSKTKLPATPSLSPLTAKQTVKSSRGWERSSKRQESLCYFFNKTDPTPRGALRWFPSCVSEDLPPRSERTSAAGGGSAALAHSGRWHPFSS